MRRSSVSERMIWGTFISQAAQNKLYSSKKRGYISSFVSRVDADKLRKMCFLFSSSSLLMCFNLTTLKQGVRQSSSPLSLGTNVNLGVERDSRNSSPVVFFKKKQSSSGLILFHYYTYHISAVCRLLPGLAVCLVNSGTSPLPGVMYSEYQQHY